MIKIRIHGRGGQGAKTAAELHVDFIIKVMLGEGGYSDVQSNPFFGAERRGAHVCAYVRICKTGIIREKGAFFDPDMVIVLDDTIVEDYAEGLKENGLVLINSKKDPKHKCFERLQKFLVATVDADAVAIKNRLGSERYPIVNTAILGAFLRVSKIASLESLLSAIETETDVKIKENQKAAEEAYNSVKTNREE